MTRRRHRLEQLLYPAVGFVGLLALWHWLVASGAAPPFLLPSPMRAAAAIAGVFLDGSIWRHLSSTLQAAAIGYVIGGAVALLVAALISEFRAVERFLLLPLIAFQAIPKVSIAPLIFLWAGFGLGGKIALVSLICFFPIFANALAGFRAADRNFIDLLRAAGATRLHIFLHAKSPAALSYIFAGLEVAVTFALIGCIVMEFIGSTAGLGFLIQETSTTYDLPLTFGTVILVGVIGVIANAAVRRLRRRLLFWESKDPATTNAGAAHA